MNNNITTPFIPVCLNENIKVKLTTMGEMRLKRHAPQVGRIDVDNDGYTIMQFWVFLQVFGEVSKIGMNKHYENTVYFQPGVLA